MVKTKTVSWKIMKFAENCGKWQILRPQKKTTMTELWMLHPQLFRYLDMQWGPHTIDKLASINVTQLRKYNSRYADPFCHGIDALFQSNWVSEKKLRQRTAEVIDSVIQIIETQKATPTVIAPKWRRKWWHQKLRARSIAPPIKLPNAKEFCIDKSISTPEPKRI